MAVITSRDSLAGLVARDDAEQIHVDVLSIDEATELLVATLGEQRTAAEPDATASLAEACGRLPLALRIAAASLIQMPTVDIAEFVTMLASGQRLSSLAIAGDPDSSVGKALSFSYERLPDTDRRMFRLIGICPGRDISVDAAAALVRSDVAEAADRLARLTDAHLLVETASGRFRMHDLVREFATGLAEAEEGAESRVDALRSVLSWYAASAFHADATIRVNPSPADWIDDAIAVRHFDGESDALKWLDLEGPNITEAIYRTEATMPSQCWQLADVLFSWMQRRRPAREWADIYTVGLRAAISAGSPFGEDVMSSGLAIANIHLGRQGDALPLFRRSLELRRGAGDLYRTLTAMRNIGGVLGELDRVSESIQILEEANARVAEALVARPDDARLKREETSILESIAYARSRRPDLGAALQAYLRAAEAAERNGIPMVVASTTLGVAVNMMKLGRFDEAESWLVRSLAVADELGHELFRGRALGNYGLLAAHRGDLNEARRYLEIAAPYEVYGVRLELLYTMIAELESKS
jgi:tetratricopeptide (TPR) repeat protein